MLALYAKAISHRPIKLREDNADQQTPILPAIECELTVLIKAKHCNAYNKLTNWQPSLAAVVHPNYAQTLSLPMQLSMMVNKAFPFSPMGIVHIANQIKVVSLPEQTDNLHIRTFFGNVYFHRLGWLFEVITLASSTKAQDTTKPQIKAISYYLAKAKHAPNIDQNTAQEMPEWIANAKVLAAQDPLLDIHKQDLYFSSSIGRQYAKVSGDYNPIHLHPFSAKLFGFKKAIAHGMYSKALAISTIAGQHHFYKSEFEIDVLFMQAIGLPTQATLTSCITDSKACAFQLSSNASHKERIFLTGSIR